MPLEGLKKGPAKAGPFSFPIMVLNVAIPVPEELVADSDSDFDLKDYFQDQIEEDFGRALDTDVWELDERAVVLEVEIDNVEVRDDAIIVYYSVSFDAYYGCKDQNYTGADERHVSGTRIGDTWVFKPYVPRERRDTFEEF
jgi:hypothetical protein